MESKDELKEIDLKNGTCYCFDDVMRYIDINFNNVLLDKKSYKKYKNIIIQDISYETFMDPKPLLIRFDETDGFIKVYDRIRYLVLRDYERYNVICDRIKYCISEKVVLYIVLIITLQESKLIHIILYLQKKC